MTSSSPSRPRAHPFRAEREFGFVVGGIVAALGAWWFWRERFPDLRPWFVGVGLALVVLGAIWPRALVWPNRGWMKLAELLARIVTPIILGVVFFLIVTPIGVVKRMTGWDPLGRRAGRRDSYWVPYSPRQHDPKHFDKMF